MVLKEVIDVIADQTGVDKKLIKPETVLADLGVDELTIAQLFMVMEEKYGIEIPDSEELQIATIRDAVALVDKALVKKYTDGMPTKERE